MLTLISSECLLCTYYHITIPFALIMANSFVTGSSTRVLMDFQHKTEVHLVLSV